MTEINNFGFRTLVSQSCQNSDLFIFIYFFSDVFARKKRFIRYVIELNKSCKFMWMRNKLQSSDYFDESLCKEKEIVGSDLPNFEENVPSLR